MSDWRRSLRRNWPYMLTGTLLSVFLWVAVSARTQDNTTIGADLFIVHDPLFVLTGREPALGRLTQISPAQARLSDAVSVRLAGDAIDLTALSIFKPEMTITVDSIAAPIVEVELDPADVRGRGGRELVGVRAVEVEPSQLTLLFERRDGKVVPVVPRVEISPEPGYALASQLRIEPSSVAVDGPESAIAAIDSVLTRTWRRQVRRSVDVLVPLEPPDPQGLVNLSTTSVRATQRIEPLLERRFPRVSVSVEGELADSLGLEPGVVDVTVSGPQSTVEALQRGLLRPQVRVAGVTNAGLPLPVLLRPLGPFLEVRVEPDSLRLVIVGGSGGS